MYLSDIDFQVSNHKVQAVLAACVNVALKIKAQQAPNLADFVTEEGEVASSIRFEDLLEVETNLVNDCLDNIELYDG